MNNSTRLFAGTSNRPLALSIARRLNLPLERTEVSRFSDGEIRVELMSNVRGSTAFVIQSTCAPANDTLMELVLLVDALRRSSAERVIAVVPYYGYSRQDRRPGYARVPVSARVVADILESSGIDHLIVCDIHALQIQGFFKIPTDNISAAQLFIADVYRNWMEENPIIVSPDVGGVGRARSVAKHLNNMDLAIVDKRRPRANVSEVMNIIGDVKDKTCIIIDDMVDTAGTLAKAADALVEVGQARRVVAYAAHGVLSGNARANLDKSHLHQLVTTDTIPLPENMRGFEKIRQLSMASTLAETIRRIDNRESVSELLD